MRIMEMTSFVFIRLRCISVHFSVKLIFSFSGFNPVFASSEFAVNIIGIFVLSVKFLRARQKPSSEFRKSKSTPENKIKLSDSLSVFGHVTFSFFFQNFHFFSKFSFFFQNFLFSQNFHFFFKIFVFFKFSFFSKL